MKIISLSFVLLFLLLTGCANNSGGNVNGIKTDYEVSSGETFSFEIISNPTTGYSWAWINQGSASLVELVSNDYIPDKPILTGSGGKEVWSFKGVKHGIDTIKLEYRRPWEPDKPAQQKSFTVKVK